ncbi:DUF7344 domain-containing protein [Halapricum desulfuricans]|uniref:DUF7344 domain-containing protein n=1 Tax=Halapricum desulfuricans TaxID=2841257 RepID=UPI001E3D959F|nr:hypothetical protein [Halapricum desulfuricans]
MVAPEKTDRRAASSSDSRLSEDRFYDALSSVQRRRVLYHLLEEGETPIEELATVLTGWEATQRGTMSTPADHTKHHLALHHIHLPLLVEAGLVAWDRESGAVTPESLEPLVRDIVRRSVEASRS